MNAFSGAIGQARLLLPWLALALVFMWVLDQLEPGMGDSSSQALNLAWRCDCPSDVPPADDADWRQVSLPEAWADVDDGHRASWYRLHVPVLAASGRNLGLRIDQGWVSHSVWLGDEQLTDGRRSGEVPQMGGRISYVRLPVVRLMEDHRVYVLAETRAWTPRLGPVTLGETNHSETRLDRRMLLRVELPRAAAMAMIFLALLCAIPALERGLAREPALAFGALSLLAWSAFIFWSTPETLWMSPRLYDPLGYIARALLLSGLLLLSAELRGGPLRWLETLLAGTLLSWAVLAYPIALLSLQWYRLVGTQFFELVLLLAGLVVVRNFHRAATVEASLSSRLLFGTVCVALVLGVRDTLGYWGWLDASPVLYLAYSAPLVAVAIGSILLLRFGAATQAAVALTKALEERVEAASVRLERELASRLAAQRQRARVEEQERLIRDMHDGSGGYLVQALAISEAGGDRNLIDAALDNALEDLAVLADPAAMESISLGDALAALVNRLQPRLAAAGIRLQWRSESGVRYPRRDMAGVLSVVRIVQEAISNVVKHAGASIVVVGMSNAADGRAVRITVADDGAGFDTSARRLGRGLDNLARRASMLGGGVELTSSVSGTELTLVLPNA